MMKLENSMKYKFDEIDSNFKITNQTLEIKENLKDAEEVRAQIKLLDTIEHVNSIEQEILPEIINNKARLDDCENNTHNLFREIKRMEEKVENKPDR